MQFVAGLGFYEITLLIWGNLLYLDILANGEVYLPTVFIFLTPPQDVAKWALRGHPTLPTPFFHPNACCFSARIPGGERGWHGSLADVCLPFGSLEKEAQDWAGGASACTASAEKVQFQGFWALGLKDSFCRCFLRSITSLFSVPSSGTGSRGLEGHWLI